MTGGLLCFYIQQRCSVREYCEVNAIKGRVDYGAGSGVCKVCNCIIGLIMVSLGASGVVAEGDLEENYAIKHALRSRALARNLPRSCRWPWEGRASGGGLRMLRKSHGDASHISREMGWMLRRVSLKNRNPLNRPDEYEAKILRQFESAGSRKIKRQRFIKSWSWRV